MSLENKNPEILAISRLPGLYCPLRDAVLVAREATENIA